MNNKVRIPVLKTTKEWLTTWFEIQRGIKTHNKLDAETVLNVLEFKQFNLDGDDFVIFNNAGGLAFQMCRGSIVRSVLESLSGGVYCYRLNGHETIEAGFCWNRPRSYLTYFPYRKEDYANGYVEFEDDVEYEASIYGNIVRQIPFYTGVR